MPARLWIFIIRDVLIMIWEVYFIILEMMGVFMNLAPGIWSAAQDLSLTTQWHQSI